MRKLIAFQVFKNFKSKLTFIILCLCHFWWFFFFVVVVLFHDVKANSFLMDKLKASQIQFLNLKWNNMLLRGFQVINDEFIYIYLQEEFHYPLQFIKFLHKISTDMYLIQMLSCFMVQVFGSKNSVTVVPCLNLFLILSWGTMCFIDWGIICFFCRLAVPLLVCCSLMNWTPLLKPGEAMLEMEVSENIVLLRQ